MADGKNRNIKIKTVYAVFSVLGFGILLIALNVYQLYNFSWNHMLQRFPDGLSTKKIVWVYSKEVRTDFKCNILQVFKLGKSL